MRQLSRLLVVFIIVTVLVGFVQADGNTVCIQDLTATEGCLVAHLSWTGTGADHYDIYRGTTSGGPFVFLAITVHDYYDDSDVVVGTTYYYVIRPADASGTELCQSNEANITIHPCSNVPEFPTLALPLISVIGLFLAVITVRKLK